MQGVRPQDRRPIVISGPLTVGKRDLSRRLCQAYPDAFAFAKSHVTLDVDDQEDGYHTTSEATFLALRAQDGFAYWETVEGASQNIHFGVSKQTIADDTAHSRVTILIVSMEAVQQMSASSDLDMRYIFIGPPGMEALERNLKAHIETTDIVHKENDLLVWLAGAKKEMEYARTPGSYSKVIINDDCDKAYKELEEYVFASSAS